MSLSFIEESSIPNDLLRNFRQKAWDMLHQVGLPSRKFETYQYVPLIKLYAHNFSLLDSFTCQDPLIFDYLSNDYYDLVFINGSYRPDLSESPEEIEIYSLNEAMDLFAMFLQNKFVRAIKEEKDPFVLMNTALHKNGVFIYLPEEQRLTKPLRVLNFTSSGETSLSAHFANIQLFMGKNSSMDVIVASHHLSKDAADLINASFYVYQEENTTLNCYEWIDYPENSWYFGSYRHHLKKEAKLKMVQITQGAKTVRRDIQIDLLEKNAWAQTTGLSYLQKEKQTHTNVLIKHKEESSTSHQLFKTVLKDQAKSSFEGKIFVEKQAQQTRAYQLSKNLVLSEMAKCHCKPNLEIFADDVKASHGATIGQLSEEDLFYMQSRGISQKDAKRILVQAFCKEVLDLFPFPSYVQRLVHDIV